MDQRLKNCLLDTVDIWTEIGRIIVDDPAIPNDVATVKSAAVQWLVSAGWSPRTTTREDLKRAHNCPCCAYTNMDCPRCPLIGLWPAEVDFAPCCCSSAPSAYQEFTRSLRDRDIPRAATFAHIISTAATIILEELDSARENV